MNVGELMDKYKLSVNYSKDRKMIEKHRQEEILAWMVSSDEKLRLRSHAYIFRSDRKLMAIVNRVRVAPKEALGIIRTMKLEREDLHDKTAEKEIVADSI